MRRVILHAGTEKTGSTFLQSVFFANRSALKKQGVLYPLSGLESGHHYWLAKALGFKFKQGPIDEIKESEALRSLKKELLKWDGDILLSSEHFDLNVCPESIGRFKEFIGGDVSLHVVLVIRNQVDYSQSLYAEGLKWAVIRTYEQFLNVTEKQGRYSYLNRYHLWRDIGANVIMVDYEYHKSSLLEAFIQLSGLGLDASQLDTPHSVQNISPSIDFLEMIRVCNLERDAVQRRELFERLMPYVRTTCPELLEKRAFCIPEAGIPIFQRAQEDNEKLAKNIGVDPRHFLGGGLKRILDKYEGCSPPDSTLSFKKILPAILKL